MIPLWYLVLGVGVSVLAVTGNGIVAYLIVTRPQLHNAANWVVLSLALADLFVGAGSLLTHGFHRASIITHNVYYNIISFLYALSTTNLCLLALERYLFITKPLRYVDLVRTRRVVLVIVRAWVAVFHSPPLALSDLHQATSIRRIRLCGRLCDFRLRLLRDTANDYSCVCTGKNLLHLQKIIPRNSSTSSTTTVQPRTRECQESVDEKRKEFSNEDCRNCGHCVHDLLSGRTLLHCVLSV